MTMIELLTKKQPWSDKSTPVTMACVLQGEKHPIPSHCPPQLGDILNQCWEFEAVNRPEFHQLFILLEDIKI